MHSTPSRGRLVALLLPLAAAGALVGLLTATWAGLWREPPTGRLALVAALGMVPAIVRAAGLRHGWVWSIASVIVVAIVSLGAAVGASPLDVVRADGETWSALGDVIPLGLGNAAATPLPLSVDRAPALGALLVLVLVGATCLIAWQIIVSRRPLAAVIATATGLAYRWTLVPPLRPVLIGVLTLLIALAAFRLTTSRRSLGPASGRAVVVGAVIVGIAFAGSVSADSAPASWWGWRNWTFGSGKGPTSLSLKQSYGPLSYPDDPILVARITAKEPVPLRAVGLETFDGTSFVATATETAQFDGSDRVRLEADTSGAPTTIVQEVAIENARTPWVLVSGRPVGIRGLGRRDVTELSDGSLRVNPALESDSTYTVESAVPDPGISALLAAPGYGEDVDPRLLTITPGSGLDPVEVPVWGAAGPARLDPERFGQYRRMYELSQRIIGDTTRPYVAVNRIEEYLRDSRNVQYDDTVSRSVGTPDLVDFLFTTKRGYCQHFAGSMALMLRMNGIPARVAVGFTADTGRFDPDKSSYEIIDRDAHSWVEVEFPGLGFLPFDPTQGRSVPNSASVSSLNYSRNDVALDIQPDLASGPVQPAPAPDRAGLEPTFNDAPVAAPSNSRRGWLWAIPGLLLAGLVIPLAAKALRRRRRRRGDERAQVLGAVREFESLLVDLGHPADAAATPGERAQRTWRDLELDAQRIYGLASTARFDPRPQRPGVGNEAWNELRRMRRSLGWRRRVRATLRTRSLWR